MLVGCVSLLTDDLCASSMNITRYKLYNQEHQHKSELDVSKLHGKWNIHYTIWYIIKFRMFYIITMDILRHSRFCTKSDINNFINKDFQTGSKGGGSVNKALIIQG